MISMFDNYDLYGKNEHRVDLIPGLIHEPYEAQTSSFISRMCFEDGIPGPLDALGGYPCLTNKQEAWCKHVSLSKIAKPWMLREIINRKVFTMPLEVKIVHSNHQ
jgi:hypothetical protein